MIELLYAGVAVLAVNCSWRAVDVAGVAEFKLEVVAFDDCAVTFLEISQEFGVVVVVGGDLAVLELLVGGVDFVDDAWVGKGQNNQYNSVKDVQYDIDSLESGM
jgi:hypothetical protein